MRYLLLSLTALFLISCTTSPHEPETNDTQELWQIIWISEVVSSNSSIITDDFDEFDDYIELYNPQDSIVSLDGFGLTDEMENIKYEFPSFATIEPDSYILIWCDAEPDQGSFHADFRISSEGEWLGLYFDVTEIIDSLSVPSLPENSAFLRNDSLYIGVPTPGFSG